MPSNGGSTKHGNPITTFWTRHLFATFIMSLPAVVTASAKVRPGREEAFAVWQVRFDRAIMQFPGYVSSEVNPPSQPGVNEWTIVLHFRSTEQLEAWQRSKERSHLIDEVLPLLVAGKLEEQVSSGSSQDGTVTQMIISKIRPGMDDAYRQWSIRIQQAQAKYPGYKGMYLQPPESGGGHWTTMLRYDSQEHLDAWLAAPERALFLKESHAFIEDQELMRLATSFPGWVPIDPSTGKGPPNWKTALLVLLGLYPIVMLEVRYVAPIFQSFGFNHAVTTFICNTTTVMITGYFTMPPFVRWFRWWLFAEADSPHGSTAKGLGILSALFLLEIALCWNLF